MATIFNLAAGYTLSSSVSVVSSQVLSSTQAFIGFVTSTSGAPTVASGTVDQIASNKYFVVAFGPDTISSNSGSGIKGALFDQFTTNAL